MASLVEALEHNDAQMLIQAVRIFKIVAYFAETIIRLHCFMRHNWPLRVYFSTSQRICETHCVIGLVRL